MCSAGVALRVLHGEDISHDVVALTAGFVLTHQLGLEESGPPSLQGLHSPDIRLNGQEQKDYSSVNSIRTNKESVSHSVTTLGHLADSCHSGDFDFGVKVVLFGHLSEEEVDLVVVSCRVAVCRLLYEG